MYVVMRLSVCIDISGTVSLWISIMTVSRLSYLRCVDVFSTTNLIKWLYQATSIRFQTHIWVCSLHNSLFSDLLQLSVCSLSLTAQFLFCFEQTITSLQFLSLNERLSLTNSKRHVMENFRRRRALEFC